MPSLKGYSIKSKDWLYLKTFITERFLDFGYLHGCLFYPSISHTKLDIDDFVKTLSNIVMEIDNRGIDSIVSEIGDYVCHSTFKRLN